MWSLTTFPSVRIHIKLYSIKFNYGTEYDVRPYRLPYVSLKMLSDIDKIQIIFPEITDGHRVVCLLEYLASSSCFFGLFNPLSNPFALVYHRRLQLWKLVEAFNSGIKVKIIQRFLHIEQASSTNIISYVLMFSLLFILPLRLTSVLSLTMALTMASVETN